MVKDYYSILAVPRTSSQTEIRKAYHRKALEYHPDKTHRQDSAYFTEIAEAYDVLSSCSKRKIYDECGEDGLKKCNYQFTSDPVKIFHDIFFGNNKTGNYQNKRQKVYTERCTRSPPLNKVKDKEIVKELFLSLEELHTGLTKRIKITKKIESTTNPNKHRMQEKILEIKVRPGWKDGTRITFEREGNVTQSSVPADLVFIIKEKKHSSFERDGDDLVHFVTVSLKRSLVGGVDLKVPTIDSNSVLDVRISRIISPGYTKVYEQHGMRSQKDYNTRGNLIVKFRIQFPELLTPEQVEALCRILPD